MLCLLGRIMGAGMATQTVNGDHEGHHELPTEGWELTAISVSATLHCLTGCAIGEISGMAIGTAAGMSNGLTIAISVALAFLFGYALTSLPLLRAGLALATVIPIALAYAVAHYFTLLVVEGQRVVVNLADPLGRGWDVLGAGRWAVDSSIFNHPTAIAVVQLLAIVVGHVVGVVAAHEKAVALLPARTALRGQWPMLVLMVAYTSAGLVLLFSP